ncbi:hypothetical protein D1BOALGB6SA_10769 [Olavius sp. associated proteobacterium Delta 1]|nr:hypothetical protein D1BOALGB6SA_10769 [Olavius sp. associated proteobacterium Delta 1]
MPAKKLKYWFDKDLAVLLSEKIQRYYKGFDTREFVKEIDEKTENLELKERIELVADQMQAKLPTDFKEAIEICRKILGSENEKETVSEDLPARD